MKIIFLDDQLSISRDSLKESLNLKFPELELCNGEEHILSEVEYWNSILLYRFDCKVMSKECSNFLNLYNARTLNKGSIFPISYGDNDVPPVPLKHLKANSIISPNSIEIISNRVGAFLGLSCIGKDHQIFLSHRAFDGREITIKIEQLLNGKGFRTWRDEAKDKDQEGAIYIGEDAQKVIEKNLDNCSAIILIDTPSVTESEWVEKEINMANARLIPILPICFRYSKDCVNKGPRFRVLKNLNRWIDVHDDNIIEEEVINYLEDFLLDIYLRKRQLPLALEKAFTGKGYSWSAIDSRKLYFHSQKALERVAKNVLSHSPIHRGLYPPYIQQFSNFDPTINAHINYRVLVYDGEMISRTEVEEVKKQTGVNNIEILHHQDIELILEDL